MSSKITNRLSFKNKKKVQQQLSNADSIEETVKPTENLEIQNSATEITTINSATISGAENETDVVAEEIESNETTTSESSETNSDNSPSSQVLNTSQNRLNDTHFHSLPNFKTSTMSSLSSKNSSLTRGLENTNFWEIKGYKPAIDRCDNGYKLGDKLKECLHERAKINQDHAKEIHNWFKKWNEIVQRGSTEYHNGKEVWGELLNMEDELSKHHTELSIKYQEFSNNIEIWLKKNYQRHIIHFNQQKYFFSEFEEAQKEWRKIIEKLNDYKKEYDNLVKKSDSSKSGEFNEKKDYLKRKCEHQIDLLNHFKPEYIQDMTRVFEETQKLERLRKKEFKKIFNQWLDCLKNQFNIFDDAKTATITNYNPENDLKWWSDNNGAGMQLILPELRNYIF